MTALSLAPLPWPHAPAADLAFPYMVWAHEKSARTSSPLSHSGVPNASAAFLADMRVDNEHPGRHALPAFEAAVAKRLGVPKEAVVAVPGASGGLAATALCFFGGARVAVEVPGYEQLRSLALRHAAQAVPLPRRLESDWDASPAELDTLLAGAARGHAFLTNTHNPSGALLSRARIAELGAVCAAHGGVLASCDIYQEFLPEAERVWTCRAAPNGITIGSLTKAYGCGPLRLGWVALGAALLDRRHALRDATYTMWVDPPTTTLAAGVRALERLDELFACARDTHARSKPLLDRWLVSTRGVRAFVPSHGLVSFPRIDGLADGHAFAEWLVRHAQVDVVPGEFFGAPGHLRVACGLPPEQLADALARLAAGIGTWSREAPPALDRAAAPR